MYSQDTPTSLLPFLLTIDGEDLESTEGNSEKLLFIPKILTIMIKNSCEILGMLWSQFVWFRGLFITSVKNSGFESHISVGKSKCSDQINSYNLRPIRRCKDIATPLKFNTCFARFKRQSCHFHIKTFCF